MEFGLQTTASPFSKMKAPYVTASKIWEIIGFWLAIEENGGKKAVLAKENGLGFLTAERQVGRNCNRRRR